MSQAAAASRKLADPWHVPGWVVPWCAIGALFGVLALLARVIDFETARFPPVKFAEHKLEGYPHSIAFEQTGQLAEAVLWWLCLNALMWIVGVVVLGLCAVQLLHAHRDDPRRQRRVLLIWLAGLCSSMSVVWFLVAHRGRPLMSLAPLLNIIDAISPGWTRLAHLGVGLAVTVGIASLITMSLMLRHQACADTPTQQMRCITVLMYGGAVFLLAWIAAATATYRLAGALLEPQSRAPVLALAPTVSLVGGILLSLMLAAGYLAAAAWLQQLHRSRNGGGVAVGAGEPSPREFLGAHWPKLAAMLMPMLPGAVGSVLQGLSFMP